MNKNSPAHRPIARKQGLVIQELPDEVLVYDLERDRAHCLNETAAFVWQRCDGRTSTAQIARTLGNQFNCEVDEQVVWLALDQLGRNHLLQRQLNSPPTVKGISRRALVRTLGIATVVAVPLVTSILTPTAQAATSCLGAGAVCSDGVQCCSGFCSDGRCGAT
jgi:Coenzyme PQQ synthesis protein D (PqqD)